MSPLFWAKTKAYISAVKARKSVTYHMILIWNLYPMSNAIFLASSQDCKLYGSRKLIVGSLIETWSFVLKFISRLFVSLIIRALRRFASLNAAHKKEIVGAMKLIVPIIATEWNYQKNSGLSSGSMCTSWRSRGTLASKRLETVQDGTLVCGVWV